MRADRDFIGPGTHEDLVDRVKRGFLTRHGRPPSAIGWAPGRVNVIGEHTDYNGGLCLPFALPHATYAAVRLRSDRELRVSSGDRLRWSGHLDDVGPGWPPGWAAYVAGVLWALDDGSLVGVDVHVESTVPVGAGLSSSASLECAVALGLSAALGLEDNDRLRALLIEAGVRAETQIVGAPTGGMDQNVALLAEAGSALVLDFGTQECRRITWPDHAQILVIDTQVNHRLVDGQYGDRRDECARAAAELGVDNLGLVTDRAGLGALGDPVLARRARHVVSENVRVRDAEAALSRGDLSDLGRLMSASHASMRDDFQISCRELDLVCAAASLSGSLGARMTGGGFGGSAIALLDSRSTHAVDRVVIAVRHAFNKARIKAPRFLLATPSAAGDAIRLT